MKYAKLTLRVFRMFLIDILLAGVIVLAYGLHHHGYAALQIYWEEWRSEDNPAESIPAPSEPVAQSKPAATTLPIHTETGPADTVVETIPDNRTDWQILYAEHFSDEIIITPNSYKSPNISVTLETITSGSGDEKVVYHVADVYVASMECLKTYTAKNKMEPNSNQFPLEMSIEAGAVFSVTGDYYTLHQSGFIVRNGYVYMNNSDKYDICVLYDSGRVEVYDKYTYDSEEILENGAVQVWNFGPSLLDENGKAKESYDIRNGFKTDDPRTGLGYYAPGHYCFVVVDGRREGYSAGMRIEELAKIFEDLGCSIAYNLDGGGSAMMTINSKMYSRPCDGRRIGDIIYVAEPKNNGAD